MILFNDCHYFDPNLRDVLVSSFQYSETAYAGTRYEHRSNRQMWYRVADVVMHYVEGRQITLTLNIYIYIII